MKSNFIRNCLGLAGVITAIFITSAQSGSLTDYGAVPAVTKPGGDLSAANQKLDFHTDLFTGRFNYQVPIVVPAGRGGLTPSLALEYSSVNKDSWCGVGWDLQFGYIQRETRYGVPIAVGASSYSDGLTFAFNFAFGGHSGRLLSVGGGVYYPQINPDFLKFIYNGTSWTVIDKSGRQYIFGDTSGSRIANSYGTFQWNLSIVTDPNGNKMTASYTADAGQLYLHQIDYNGNTNSPAIATNCSVIFDLLSGNRSDVQSSELSGTEIITEKLLQDVQVVSQGRLVRKYVLGYISSPSTEKALLQTVTEYGSDGTTSLPPLSFGYSLLTKQFQDTVAWPIVSQTTSGDTYGDCPGTPDSMLIDVNGDGRPDRVMTEHTGTYTYYNVQLNTGSGFSSTVDHWGISEETSDTTEATWGGVDITLSSGALQSISTLIDLDGDLLPDRVLRQHVINGSEPFYDHYQFQANSGTGFNTRANFGGLSSINATFTGSLVDVPGSKTGDGLSDLTTLIDMNGDGLPDRVMLSSTTGRFDIQYNYGTGFNSSVSSWLSVTTDANSVRPYAPRARIAPNISGVAYIASDLMDMNGDGLPDRVLYEGVQLNNGHGFDSYQTSPWSYSSDFPAILNTTGGFYDLQFIDINGDGLPDFVSYSSNGTYFVKPNTGKGFNNGSYYWSNVDTDGYMASGGNSGWDSLSAWDGYGSKVMFIDINGDGLVDRVLRSYYGGDYLYVQLNAGPFPDLMNVIYNGIGGSMSITYTNSTTFDNSDGTRPRLPMPMYAVTSVTVNDGRGNSGTTRYIYKYGLYDTYYREFRGFGAVQQDDPMGESNVHYFHQGGGWDGSPYGEYSDGMAKAGMVYRIDNYGSDDKLYSTTVNKVDEVEVGSSGVTFPFVSQTVTMDYEGNSGYRASAKAYGYQAVYHNLPASTGNLITETNYGEVLSVNLAAHTFTASTNTAPLYKQYTYAAIASNTNILDRVASLTVSADAGGSTILRRTTNSYFAVTGNLQTRNDLICPGTYATTAYTYDSYGNVQTTTDPVGIVTTFNYDSATATYPTRKYTGVLASNLIEYSLYDTRSGSLLASTNMQGLVVTNGYDVFLRLTNSATSITPNGAATLWRKKIQYNLGGISSGSSLNYIRVQENDPADSANGYHESYTYFDGLGRPIQTRSEAETGNYRVGDVAYDLRGAVTLQTYPVFQSGSSYVKPSGTRTNTYTQYDFIGRANKINPCATAVFDSNGNPGSPTVLTGDSGSPVGPTSTAFSEGSNPWATVVTNALGKIHKYYKDAFGRNVQIVEVTSGGNFTTSLGYNAVGDLTSVTDNAGNQTSYYYDSMGRRVAVADPDMGLWQYAYDAAGKLTIQTDAKGQKAELYYADPAGRLTKREGWSSAGQVISTTTYLYDSNGGDVAYSVYPGQMFSVTDDEGWQKFGYDVRGRATNTVRYLARNGNTYTNRSVFDDADRLVASVYPNGGPTVTNIFDTGGNLTQVKQVGGSNTVYFLAKGFDEFDRLKGIGFGNGVQSTNIFYGISQRLKQIASAKTTNIQNLTYTYDAIGNVKSVADGVYGGLANGTLGNIQYDDLNRLTSLTNASGSFAYGFDSIGNLKTNGEAGSSAYVYNTSRPHTVKSANGVNYAYDANGNMLVRGTQRLAFDVNNRLSYVVTSNSYATFGYDATGSRLWKLSSGTNGLQVWIGGNYEEKNGLVLYHISAGGRLICTFDKTGTNVVEYYHPDNLTSTSIQTDQSGNQIQNYGYSAFGRSRFTQSASVFPVSRRYTSQVLDDDTGLYYYNFRYYDPQLARFISPDDIIPDASDPQTYNRYSYCINNPLRYTDPSGHEEDDLTDVPVSLSYGSLHSTVRQSASAASARLYDNSITEMHTDAAMGRAVAELNPVVGAVNSGYQAAVGKDAMDYHALSGKERALSGIQAAASLAPGILKAGEVVGEGSTILRNAAKGRNFENQVQKDLQAIKETTASQITLETKSGVKTKVDFATKDEHGAIGLTEAKSSQTAPLTKNQAKAFPEIEKSGAVVKGAGKPGFPGGTQIPPTKVDIVRPPE